MLKELISEEVIEPRIATSWRASQVGMCETYLCRQRLGHAAEPIPGRVRHLFDDGHVHERDIATRLVGKGIDVKYSCLDGQAEVVCSEDPFVPGHPDGIIRTPSGELTLDYADENFRPGQFCLLEITAPGHFPFMRLQKTHMREAIYPKYVQIQLYLNSPEIRNYADCAVAIAKSKNTSALYEEGISFDKSVVDYELEKLKRLEDLIVQGLTSDFRCNDWRRNLCRYRRQCFSAGEAHEPLSSDVLSGESLKEYETLHETALAWRRGKTLEEESKVLIQDARDQFRAIIEEYGCRGLMVNGVRALMVDEGATRRCDFELLRRRFPEAFDEAVSESIRERYVRVS